MAQVAIGGTAFLKVDGRQYSLRGNFKVMPTVKVREGVAGSDGIHGFTEKYVVPYIDGEITDRGGLSVQQVAAISESTITLELVNGKTYVLTRGWYAGEAVLDATEGKMPAKFEGYTCQELLAS